MTFHTFHRQTLAPLQTLHIQVTGTFFLCVEATGSFQIGFNDSTPAPCQLGLGYIFSPGDGFSRIQFSNPSYDTKIVLGYFVSNAAVIDERANIVPDRSTLAIEAQAPTIVVPVDDTSLAVGATLQLTGDRGYFPNARRSVVVSNKGAYSLEVVAPNGAWTVFPGRTLQVHTSYPVALWNPGPSPAQFCASEIYYSYTPSQQLLASLAILTALPSGAVDVEYAQQLEAAGGSGDYTWCLYSGTLPTGLSLTGAGLISGTPAEPGTFVFTIKALDAVQPARKWPEKSAYRRYAVMISDANPSSGIAGLIAYYKLDAEGAAAVDSVAGRNTNYNAGAYSIVPGKISQAYRWAGAVRLRLVPGDPFDMRGKSFTLRLWVRLNVENVSEYANLIRLDGGYALRVAPAGVHGEIPSQNVPYWNWTSLGLGDGIVWGDSALDQNWRRLVIWWNHLTNTMGIRIDNGADATFVAVGDPAIYNAFCMAGGAANEVETCEVGLWEGLWTSDDFAHDWNNGNGRTYPDL